MATTRSPNDDAAPQRRGASWISSPSVGAELESGERERHGGEQV